MESKLCLFRAAQTAERSAERRRVVADVINFPDVSKAAVAYS